MTQQIRIIREWAMPSAATFTIKPIKSLLDRYVGDGKGWADPYSGNNSPAEFTNDLNPNTKAKDHMLALDWAKEKCPSNLEGVIFDPPYSYEQVSRKYKEVGRILRPHHDTNAAFFSAPKDVLATKIRAAGVAICFGWNSSGFGLSRGFELIEILLVAHGAHHNDTICTVERKAQNTL